MVDGPAASWNIGEGERGYLFVWDPSRANVVLSGPTVSAAKVLTGTVRGAGVPPDWGQEERQLHSGAQVGSRERGYAFERCAVAVRYRYQAPKNRWMVDRRRGWVVQTVVPVQGPLLGFRVIFRSITRTNADTVVSGFAEVLRLVDVYGTS